MSTFTIRIKLYGAADSDYRSLQTEMTKELFTVSKKAPTAISSLFSWNAEFKKRGNLSLHEVNAGIFRASKKIGKKFSFSTVRNRD